MRVGLGLVAATMLSLGSGCAHLAPASESALFEIAPPEPPPAPLPAHHEPWTRRKTLLVSGIVVGAIGAALMIGGGIGYSVAILNPHPGPACRSCVPPIDTTASDASIYTVSAGAAPLAIGVALMLAGFTHHE